MMWTCYKCIVAPTVENERGARKRTKANTAHDGDRLEAQRIEVRVHLRFST